MLVLVTTNIMSFHLSQGTPTACNSNSLTNLLVVPFDSIIQILDLNVVLL